MTGLLCEIQTASLKAGFVIQLEGGGGGGGGGGEKGVGGGGGCWRKLIGGWGGDVMSFMNLVLCEASLEK